MSTLDNVYMYVGEYDSGADQTRRSGAHGTSTSRNTVSSFEVRLSPLTRSSGLQRDAFDRFQEQGLIGGPDLQVDTVSAAELERVVEERNTFFRSPIEEGNG